jgi:hypothetical protein
VEEELTGAFTRDASYANSQVWVSCHSANPGSTGAHEVTAGAGVGGRQQATFSSGGSGSDPTNALVAFQLSGVTVSWYGFWTAQTGGTFLGGFPMAKTPQLGTAINGSSIITIPAHGLTVNTPVRLYTAPNAQSAIPAGLTADTTFYVKTVPSADTVTLAAAPGGTAIVVSSSGGFIEFTDETEVIGSLSILQFTVGNLVYSTVS